MANSSGRQCTLCSHPQRIEIDKALIDGSSYRDIAGRFEVSKSAVARHANDHIAEALSKVSDLRERVTADRLIAELRMVRASTIDVFEEARSMKDHPSALNALARLESQLKLQAQLAGELIERVQTEQLSVVFSNEWQRFRPVLMDALLPFPDAMHSVVAAISRIEPQLPAVQVFRVPARVEPEPPEPVDAE